MMAIVNKVIIVEGKSDKKRVQQVIAEPVNIICTHGTMSIDKLDDMIESLFLLLLNVILIKWNQK